ncbi:MAG: hypothetical protein NTZ05_13000, partial [Chloroflexi bacterium]|nr:hypothetical protein [Chloroflexota bacterium]
QVRMLQPGMPKAGAWYWLIATTATRWLVNSPLFDGVRDIFAVTGGPLAMAGMGATLGLIYGGVTGVALLLLAPPTALPQAEPPLNAPSPAAPTPPPP